MVVSGTPGSKQNWSLIHRFLERENTRINKSKVSGDHDAYEDEDYGDQNEDGGHNDLGEDGNLSVVSHHIDRHLGHTYLNPFSTAGRRFRRLFHREFRR